MRNVIDTNVWIDALSGKLSADAFLKITVQASWAGYSAITRLELFGLPGLEDEEEHKIVELLKPFPEIPVDSKTIESSVYKGMEELSKNPKPGEIWLGDLGLAAKTRPIRCEFLF